MGDGGSISTDGTLRIRVPGSNETVTVSKDHLASPLPFRMLTQVRAPGTAPVDTLALVVQQIHVNCLLLEIFLCIFTFLLITYGIA